MQQFFALRADSLVYRWVSVTQIAYCDAGYGIQITVIIFIQQPRAFAAFKGDG